MDNDKDHTGFKPNASFGKRDFFLSKLQLEVTARAQRGGNRKFSARVRHSHSHKGDFP